MFKILHKTHRFLAIITNILHKQKFFVNYTFLNIFDTVNPGLEAITIP